MSEDKTNSIDEKSEPLSKTEADDEIKKLKQRVAELATNENSKNEDTQSAWEKKQKRIQEIKNEQKSTEHKSESQTTTELEEKTMKEIYTELLQESEPVVESTPEPVVESTPEPVVESTPEPVVESTPEPVVESTPEPVVESTPEPVVESTPEPVVESTPEPVVESTPDEKIEEKVDTDVLEEISDKIQVSEEKPSESLLETVSDAEVNSRISFEEFTDEKTLISHDVFGNKQMKIKVLEVSDEIPPVQWKFGDRVKVTKILVTIKHLTTQEVEEGEFDIEAIERELAEKRHYTSTNRWIPATDIKNGYVIGSMHTRLISDASALDYIVF